MKQVTPKIFHLASTRIDKKDMQRFLTEMECPNWGTNVDSEGPEKLIEVAGKFCYKSFHADMNPNLTNVRDSNNKGYIGNILKSKHGSVIEHAYDTYAILNVSRVFTHELVRHRLANYSQESLRFVRLTDLKYYYPDAFQSENLDDLHDSLIEKGVDGLEDRKDQVGMWETDLAGLWLQTFRLLEDVQRSISTMLCLDELPGNFDIKKKITSAMRRLAPIGLTTGIIVTTNHRNWRHLIEMRTEAHAEEEIRKVFYLLAMDLQERYPNIYQDMTVVDKNAIVFDYSKI